MTNDMTTGNPVKLIIYFMIPTCLGNIFQQFYNLADSIVAGRFIGVNALAAIGSTSSLIFLVIGWLNGLTSGFSILVAQHFGAKKYDRMRHYIAMSIFLCILFVVVMTAALEYFNYPILRLMNAPEEIIGDVGAYMAVIYAGLAVTAAYNALAAVLRALGDGKSPLYFLIISGVLNVVLDVVFIVYFHMGVVGCGYATVIAQAVSALLCLIYIIRKFDILRLSRQDFSPDLRAVSQLLGMGIPMGLQFPSRPSAPSSCRARSMPSAPCTSPDSPRRVRFRAWYPPSSCPLAQPSPPMWGRTGAPAISSGCTRA